MVIKFLGKLLSGNDEISSNRTIATIAFAAFLYVILYSLHKQIFDEIISTYLNYLLVIILAGLGMKGLEKISSFFKK
jgi:hypothetical protein